VIQAASQ